MSSFAQVTNVLVDTAGVSNSGFLQTAVEVTKQIDICLAQK